MRKNLLQWQWANYPDVHADRLNVLLHVLTVPVFMAGTIAVVAAPFVSGWLAPAGLAAMAAAMGVQGRGHAREAGRPVPFDGAADLLARMFVENWVTFPRYFLTKGPRTRRTAAESPRR